MKKIAITGTKGKTTIVRIIDYILLGLGNRTLSVDSENILLNGNKLYGVDFSKKLSGLIPPQCPGRFLYLGMDKNNERNIDFSIFETTIGCYISGLGYKNHDIGILTNIYEDHIGKEIKNKKDIAHRKRSFISRISDEGCVICNYDDKEIYNITKKSSKSIYFITRDYCNYKKNKNIIIYVCENKIIIKLSKKELVYDITRNKYSFYGNFLPSVYNIGFSLGSLLKIVGEEVFLDKFNEITKLLDKYEIDIYGGRTYLTEYKQRKIILDYAHEKQSLKYILDLSKKLSTNKTIAVVRLSPDRENFVYEETGKFIANMSDNFIVYDKIDGIDRKKHKYLHFSRKPGEVMKIFGGAISKHNKNTYQIIYWKDAIKKAIEISNIGDCIVIIANKPKETGEFIESILSS